MDDFVFKAENQFSQKGRSRLCEIAKGVFILAFLVFITVCGAQAWADDYYWIGGGATNDWNDTANWSADNPATATPPFASVANIPQTGDSVIFNTAGSYSFDNSVSIDIQSITVGTASDAVSISFEGNVSATAFYVHGGSVNFSGTNTIGTLNTYENGATVTISGGSTTIGNYSFPDPGTDASTITVAGGATLEIGSGTIPTLNNDGVVNATGAVVVNNYTGGGSTSGSLSLPTTYYWIGNAGDNWNDGNNWSNSSGGASVGSYPQQSNHTAVFNTTGPFSFADATIIVGKIESSENLTFSGTVEIGGYTGDGKITNTSSLTLGGYSGTGEIENSGTLKINSANNFTISTIANNGTFQNNSTGNVTVTALTNSAGGTIENAGGGTLTIITLTMTADSTVTNTSGKTTIETLSGAHKASLSNSGTAGTSITINGYNDEPAIETTGQNIILGGGTISSFTVNGDQIVIKDLITVTGDAEFKSGSIVRNNGESDPGALAINGNLINAGTIGRITVAPRKLASLVVGGTTTNTGAIYVYGDQTYKDDITNNGTITVDAGKTLTAEKNTTNAGTIKVVDNASNLTAATINFDGDFINTGTYEASGSTINFGGNVNNKTGTFTDENAEITATGADDQSIDFGSSTIEIASFTYTPADTGKTLAITTPTGSQSSFGDFTATANTGNAVITIDGDNKFSSFTTDAVKSITMTGDNKFAGDVAITKDTKVTLNAANTFYGNFTLTGDTAAEAELTLGDANTFNGNFTFTNGKTLTVDAAQTVVGTFLISGADSDHLLTVTSNGSGSFEVPATPIQTAYYLDVDRAKVEITTGKCFAANSKDTSDADVEKNGWYVLGDGLTVVWNGTDNSWENAENWEIEGATDFNVVPGKTSATITNTTLGISVNDVNTTSYNVKIPEVTSKKYPETSDAYTVEDFTIGDGFSGDSIDTTANVPLLTLGAGSITVNGTLANSGRIVYSGAGRITDGTNPINDAANGGTIEYTGGGQTIEDFGYANLIVAASSTITSGGDITVSGTAEISGEVSGVNSFVVGGAATIKADIATTTTQTYNDAVTLGGGNTLTVTDNTKKIAFNGGVTVGATGATFNANVELASGKTMAVGANAPMVFGGNFTNSGTYSGNGSSITFEGNFTNSGTFTDATAAITATGKAITSGAAAIDFGTGISAASFTYAPVDASGTPVTEGSLTISGDNIWGDFTFGTDGNGIKGTLAVNGAQTINGALTLVGNGVETTNLLVITTTSSGSFVIGATDQTSGQYLRVIKNKVTINDGASDGFFYAKDSSYDSDPDFGEHKHWVLLNDGMQFVWTAEGSDKTDWAEADNWNLGMVPGLDIATSGAPMDTRYYNVTIPDAPTGGEFPKIGAAQEYIIKDLKIGENNNSDATLELAASSNIVLNDNDGDASTKPTLSNFGTIIYSDEGRIVDDGATPKPINDVAKGKVEYKGNAKTLTEFVDPDGTTSNYFDLQIDSDAELTSGGDIVVANAATISGKTSGVKSFTVTKKASFEDANSDPVSFATTGDQTYKDEVTVSTELSLGDNKTKNITFEKNVASDSAIAITNSGVFKTDNGANIDLSGGGTLVQDSNSTGESQIGGSIITDDTTTDDIVVFKNDVYIYGTDASTFGGGSGNIVLSSNLHIAADSSATKTIASPLTAKNIILYSGTLNIEGTSAALTTTQDLILLGEGYKVDDKNDAVQSQAENLFAYNHASRDGTTHAKHSYTDTFKTQCPDGTTGIPDGSDTNKFKGKLTVADDKTITVGKNFYGNGIEITGADDWNLVIPDNNSQASAFAELYNSSITNCKVAPSAGGAQAFVAAAESCTVTDCDATDTAGVYTAGIFKSRLVIDSVRMVYDDILEVSFKYNEGTDAVYLENSKGEIAKAASQIILGDGATGVGVKIYRTFNTATGACGAECTTSDTTDIAPSTNLDGDDATVLYIKANKKWNTDATGVYAGSEESTDRTGKHQTTIPYLNIPKALSEGVVLKLYETIRDNRKNRIAHYYSETPDVGAADKTMNEDPGKTYTKIEDKCSPVLIAVYTGQELHSITSQTDYDAHNFIEFVYSEPVNVGDGTLNVTKTDVNKQATAGLGKTTNAADGFAVAGIANFAKGKIDASLKPSVTGDSPHSLYRNFAIKAADAPADQPCRVRLAIAGYVNGTVTGGYKNWVGYITSATCPANDSAVTALANPNLKDLNGNSIDAAGVENYKIPTLKVKQSLVESGVTVTTMYGIWDVTPPSFAPMRVNGENNWHSPYNPTAPDDPTSCEIVGYVSSGTYLTELEVHMLDNEPKYTNADTYQWYSRVGWAAPAANNTYGAIQSDTADLIGGSRPFAVNARTSGGIRTCTLAGAESAFSYVASSSPSSDNFASIRTGANSAYFSTIVENRTSNSVPASDSNYFKLVFEGGKELSADATFEVTFDSTLCYITDLAGNRIQCGVKTLRSIDRTPPSFNITAVPLGTNKMLIVFADEVNVGTIKLKKNAAAIPDELPALKYIPKALKLTTATSGIDIDQDVPAQVAFTNSKATAIVVTLKQNAVLDDITEGVYVEVIKSDEYSYDSITGTTDAKVTYIQDPVGNFVQAGKRHAFSDFAVNAVQMQYAYSVVDPEADGEDSRFDVYSINQTVASVREWGEEQKGNGSVKVGKEIIMNGFLYDGTSDNTGGVAGKDISAYFDHTPEAASISKDFNSLTGKKWRIWLPTAYGSISDVANTGIDYTATASSAKPMDERQSFDIDIAQTDAESLWHDGDQIKFLFELNGCTVDHFADGHPQPLYCLRLKNPADLTSLDLWSFKTSFATLQRGGVSVLNNVINVNAGERATIQVQTDSPEKVKVMIMTLDGNIVKYLDSYPFDAGTHYYVWDGTTRGGATVARGLYFVRVIGPGIDETRKIMCVK